MLSQWHINDPGHSAKSAGGRLPLNTHAPYVCGFVEMTLLTDTWFYGVPKMCTETTAVSHGTNCVETKQCHKYTAVMDI